MKVICCGIYGKKSQNYPVLRLKSADMGRKVQETNAYDEAEN
jgi:hypothetical protein